MFRAMNTTIVPPARAPWRTLLLLGLLLATLMSATLPATSATAQERRPGLASTWEVTVTRSDGVVERGGQANFSPGGVVETTGENGVGAGTWSQIGKKSYTYTTRTETDFGSLVVTGFVEVNGNRVSGVGQGVALDKEGLELGRANSELTGKRVK